jgi:hypothetical protein
MRRYRRRKGCFVLHLRNERELAAMRRLLEAWRREEGVPPRRVRAHRQEET